MRTTTKGALLALVIAGTIFLTGAIVAYARFTETATVASNTFSTAASFGATYFLHNNPTPPGADTTSQTNLPLDTVTGTASTLYNYDSDRDASPGLLIARGGSGASESDVTKYQNWRTSILASDLTIDGTVDFTVWSGIRDFDQNRRGYVQVFLRHYNGSTFSELCNGSLDQANWQGGSTTWVTKTISFNCPSYTIPAGDRLEVKVIVNNAAEDKMWLAYDTASYSAYVDIP